MSNALQTLKILHIIYVPLERTQSYMCALTVWPLTYSDLRLQLLIINSVLFLIQDALLFLQIVKCYAVIMIKFVFLIYYSVYDKTLQSCYTRQVENVVSIFCVPRSSSKSSILQ